MTESSKNRNQGAVREFRSQAWFVIILMLLGVFFSIYKYFEAIPNHSGLFALVMGGALVGVLVTMGICIDHYLRMALQGPRMVSRGRGLAVGISGAMAIALWVVGLLLR